MRWMTAVATSASLVAVYGLAAARLPGLLGNLKSARPWIWVPRAPRSQSGTHDEMYTSGRALRGDGLRPGSFHHAVRAFLGTSHHGRFFRPGLHPHRQRHAAAAAEQSRPRSLCDLTATVKLSLNCHRYRLRPAPLSTGRSHEHAGRNPDLLGNGFFFPALNPKTYHSHLLPGTSREQSRLESARRPITSVRPCSAERAAAMTESIPISAPIGRDLKNNIASGAGTTVNVTANCENKDVIASDSPPHGFGELLGGHARIDVDQSTAVVNSALGPGPGAGGAGIGRSIGLIKIAAPDYCGESREVDFEGCPRRNATSAQRAVDDIQWRRRTARLAHSSPLYRAQR